MCKYYLKCINEGIEASEQMHCRDLVHRQALITQHQHTHASAWLTLSTLAGFKAVADAQIEALVKTHTLTTQVFVMTVSNYVNRTILYG
jgi:hypothetical protein